MGLSKHEKVAILIGFQYDTTDSYLPGIVVDLYQAYTFIKTINLDRIVILTDIKGDKETSVLMRAITNGTVDGDILTFIESIKSLGIYHGYEGLDNMVSLITNTCTNSNNVIVYYTGHGAVNKLIIPYDDFGVSIIEVISDVSMKTSKSVSTNSMLTTTLKNTIVNAMNSDGELLMIMDCCHGSSIRLPYKIHDDGNYYLTSDNSKEFTTQKIICYTSALSDEKSFISKNGSTFTYTMFSGLVSGNRSTIGLLENQSKIHKQTSTVYSSHPDNKILWPWVFGLPNIKVVLTGYNSLILVNDNSN